MVGNYNKNWFHSYVGDYGSVAHIYQKYFPPKPVC